MNNNKFTYDKFETVKFGFSIFDMFSSVLLKLFPSLINTKYDIQHLSVVLLHIPLVL